MNCSPTRLRPCDFPGKNTGVGCHFLLQEIFLTQGLNPGLPHCRQALYLLSHQGSRTVSLLRMWTYMFFQSMNIYRLLFVLLGPGPMHPSTCGLSCVQLFATPCAVAHQAPLSMKFPRILEWVVISSSRGSSQSRDRTRVSCISCVGRWILHKLSHLRSPLFI